MQELIDEMSYDLAECHVDYLDDAKLYTDYDTMAQKLVSRGYCKRSEWISVEERLPDKYGDVICCTRNGTIWQLTYNPTYKLFNVSYDNVENAMDVTHWMPLPEPPKMKGGE